MDIAAEDTRHSHWRNADMLCYFVHRNCVATTSLRSFHDSPGWQITGTARERLYRHYTAVQFSSPGHSILDLRCSEARGRRRRRNGTIINGDDRCPRFKQPLRTPPCANETRLRDGHCIG